MTGIRNRKVAVFGGAAAVALAVGFGGVGISSLGGTTTPAAHPTISAPAPANAPSDVHVATLTGCISGLDC